MDNFRTFMVRLGFVLVIISILFLILYLLWHVVLAAIFFFSGLTSIIFYSIMWIIIGCIIMFIFAERY